MRRTPLFVLWAVLAVVAFPEPAACAVTQVTLTLDAPASGVVPWHYVAGVDPAASDACDACDMGAPPYPPFLEIRSFSQSVGCDLMWDFRDGADSTESWDIDVHACSVPVPWSASVTITWDLSSANGWTYTLHDLTNSTQTPLTPGGSYILSMNGPDGPDLLLEAAAPATSIAEAKARADGAAVSVDGIVTAAFPLGDPVPCFYIEDADRICGIGIHSSTGVSVGDMVEVSGTMATSMGERVVVAASTTVVIPGVGVPAPLYVTNLGMCGGEFGLQSAVLNNASTDSYAGGFNNVGLLVVTTGRVTYVDPSGGPFFYIDDGSGLSDGSGQQGVCVMCYYGTTLPAFGSYVRVRGIAGTIGSASEPRRLLRPTCQGDILGM